MPVAPLHSLKKAEILWLGNHKCRHNHTYLEHWNCYITENPNREKIGFLDIEASNLDADFGIMLSYCIKEFQKKKIYYGIITKNDLKKNLDKNVVRKCINDIGLFDRIITYYGKRFDVPFIRTRALNLGIEFPNYGTLLHNDLYFLIRNRMKLSSNRLENACRVLLGKTQKTRIDASYWIRALQGNPKALSYILDHNKKDVIDLERLYLKVINFASKQDTSI